MRFALAGQTVDVRPMPERDSNGYGGMGYGGDHLFLAWVEDCFSPPVYAIRADSFCDAVEAAECSLCPIVTEDDLGRPIEEFCEGEWADEQGIRWTSAGDLVWHEALKVVQVR